MKDPIENMIERNKEPYHDILTELLTSLRSTGEEVDVFLKSGVRITGYILDFNDEWVVISAGEDFGGQRVAANNIRLDYVVNFKTK